MLCWWYISASFISFLYRWHQVYNKKSSAGSDPNFEHKLRLNVLLGYAKLNFVLASSSEEKPFSQLSKGWKLYIWSTSRYIKFNDFFMHFIDLSIEVISQILNRKVYSFSEITTENDRNLDIPVCTWHNWNTFTK